jgi:hypothetical protein
VVSLERRSDSPGLTGARGGPIFFHDSFQSGRMTPSWGVYHGFA